MIKPGVSAQTKRRTLPLHKKERSPQKARKERFHFHAPRSMVFENSRHASSETLRNHPSPHNPTPEQTHMPVNLFTLFMAFLKAGGLTVGNGYAIVEP
ncbi:MAG: hypothetical protein SOR67_04665, partial [Alloprevotella sp.]|nr:hypothetical protein [Alloprevotella sp.]